MPLVETTEAVHQIVDVFDDLHARGAHPADAFFFFVGAGISAPQVPLAGAIEEECRRRVGDRVFADAPAASSSGMDRYTYWLAKAFPQPVGRQQYFRSLIETKSISAANLRLAHLLLSDRAPRLVLTPNFDDFLSRALDLFGKPHVSCDHPALAERIDPERTEDIQILHVHGTYWFYDLRNLRGELRDRAEAAAAYQSIAWRVYGVMENRSPLVIGYSGWEDDVFMAALRRRLAARSLRYNLYWFCYRREDAAALPAFLTERDDVVIVVPDEAPAGSSQSGAPQGSAPKDRALEGAAAVFDSLIRALELEVPPLTQNPLSFFAGQLRRSLIPVEQQLGGSAEDVYGMNPLIERIEALAVDWIAERPAGEHVEDPDLVAVRNALRRSQYREALEHAAAIELERLAVEHLAELAESAWLASSALLDNSDDELRGYRLAVAAYDAFVSKGGTPSDALALQTARALIYAAITLWTRGASDEAVAAYDEVVQRFGDSADPALREQAATALVNEAAVLGELGRGEEAVAVYDEVVRRFGEAEELSLREQVAMALRGKGYQLGELGRGEEALPSFDEVVARFGEATDLPLERQVAMSLVNRGYRLAALGRGEEAVPVYDDVVRRFDAADDGVLREQVALALRNKGTTFGELGRGEDEVAVYDELVRRFGDAWEPGVREQVAMVLVNKGVALGDLGRGEEAVEAFDDVVARFGDAAEPQLREQVAMALRGKGYRLGELGRGEEALPSFDEVLARFGDAEEVPVQKQVALALLNKAFRLNALERGDEAVAAYDELVGRFGESGEPALREQVATALVDKGAALSTAGQTEAAAAAYAEVARRFGDDAEPEIRALVDQARAAADEPDAGGETD